jgi:hypothetical protein
MRPLLLAFFCLLSLSCTAQKSGKKKNLSKKDKKEMLSVIDYNTILDNKTVDGIPVQTIAIGNVRITSGKLIATDPLSDPSPYPLDITLPKGDYPVTLYEASTKEMGNRIALAKLEISKNKAVKWVLTVQDSTDTSVLKPGEYFGFGVDAGVAGFYDPEAGKKLAEFYERFPKGVDVYTIFFAAEFKKNAKDQNNPQDIGEWINYTFPDTGDAITMFSSGYGDGVYPVYKGIDAKGKICCIIIDFQVLLHPEEK